MANPSTPSRIDRRTWILFPIAATGYLILSGYRLLAYDQPAFDLGIYDQSLWLLWNGELFNTVTGLHVFGAHFSPILYLLAPLSPIPGGALPELAAQAVFVAAGVFPAILLGRTVGRPWLFGIIYVAHPGIVSGMIWGFRPWNLATPVLMLLAYLLVRRSAIWVITSVTLVLFLFREDMGLWVLVLLAIAQLSGYRKWSESIIPGLLSVLWGSAALAVVIPQFAPDGDYVFQRAYSDTTAVGGWQLAAVLAGFRVVYLVAPIGVLAFLDNARRSVPLVLPIVGLMLLGGNARFVLFHYEMLFVPALLMLIAMGDTRRFSTGRVAVGLVVTIFLIGPLRPWPIFGQQAPLVPATENTALSETSDWLAARVTDEDGLTLPSNLVPHFSERRQISVFPYPLDTVTFPPYPMICSVPNYVVEPLEREVLYTTPVWDTTKLDFTEVLRNDYFVVYESGQEQPGICRSLADRDAEG